MELVRKQTYLTAEQDRRLKELAERHHTTEAEILRRALDSWLAAETGRNGGDPFEGLIGLVAGPTEVDHDDIYD
jgi:predicted transcriptional regulator